MTADIFTGTLAFSFDTFDFSKLLSDYSIYIKYSR